MPTYDRSYDVAVIIVSDGPWSSNSISNCLIYQIRQKETVISPTNCYLEEEMKNNFFKVSIK